MTLEQFLEKKKNEIETIYLNLIKNEKLKIDFIEKIIKKDLDYFSSLPIEKQYEFAQKIFSHINSNLLTQTNIEEKGPRANIKEFLPIKLGYVTYEGSGPNYKLTGLTEKGKNFIGEYNNIIKGV